MKRFIKQCVRTLQENLPCRCHIKCATVANTIPSTLPRQPIFLVESVCTCVQKLKMETWKECGRSIPSLVKMEMEPFLRSKRGVHSCYLWQTKEGEECWGSGQRRATFAAVLQWVNAQNNPKFNYKVIKVVVIRSMTLTRQQRTYRRGGRRRKV